MLTTTLLIFFVCVAIRDVKSPILTIWIRKPQQKQQQGFRPNETETAQASDIFHVPHIICYSIHIHAILCVDSCS